MITKNQINHYDKQRRVLMANASVSQSKSQPIDESRRAKPKPYHEAPTHWLKFYEEAVIESEETLYITKTRLFKYIENLTSKN